MDHTEFKINKGYAFIESFDNNKFIINVCHKEPRYKKNEIFCYYTRWYTVFVGIFSQLKIKQYPRSTHIFFKDDAPLDFVIKYLKDMFKDY